MIDWAKGKRMGGVSFEAFQPNGRACSVSKAINDEVHIFSDGKASTSITTNRKADDASPFSEINYRQLGHMPSFQLK